METTTIITSFFILFWAIQTFKNATVEGGSDVLVATADKKSLHQRDHHLDVKTQHWPNTSTKHENVCKDCVRLQQKLAKMLLSATTSVVKMVTKQIVDDWISLVSSNNHFSSEKQLFKTMLEDPVLKVMFGEEVCIKKASQKSSTGTSGEGFQHIQAINNAVCELFSTTLSTITKENKIEDTFDLNFWNKLKHHLVAFIGSGHMKTILLDIQMKIDPEANKIDFNEENNSKGSKSSNLMGTNAEERVLAHSAIELLKGFAKQGPKFLEPLQHHQYSSRGKKKPVFSAKALNTAFLAAAELIKAYDGVLQRKNDHGVVFIVKNDKVNKINTQQKHLKVVSSEKGKQEKKKLGAVQEPPPPQHMEQKIRRRRHRRSPPLPPVSVPMLDYLIAPVVDNHHQEHENHQNPNHNHDNDHHEEDHHRNNNQRIENNNNGGENGLRRINNHPIVVGQQQHAEQEHIDQQKPEEVSQNEQTSSNNENNKASDDTNCCDVVKNDDDAEWKHRMLKLVFSLALSTTNVYMLKESLSAGQWGHVVAYTVCNWFTSGNTLHQSAKFAEVSEHWATVHRTYTDWVLWLMDTIGYGELARKVNAETGGQLAELIEQSGYEEYWGVPFREKFQLMKEPKLEEEH